MMISANQAYLGHTYETYNTLFWNIGGWSVATIRRAIDGHDTGRGLAVSWALGVVASRYPSIFGALRQRKAPPLGLKTEVTGGDRGPARLARDDFALAMKDAKPLWGDVFDEHAMMGFSVLQVVMRYNDERGVLMPEVTRWPMTAIQFDPLEVRYLAITTEGLIPIVDDGHWLIVGTGETPHLNGAIRALALQWAKAGFTDRDEAALAEYLGRKVPIGYLPPNVAAKSDEGLEMADAIRDVGKAKSGALFPNESKVETLDNIDAGAAQLFGGVLDRCSRNFAIALLGQSGTVSPGSPGVYTSPLFGEVAFAIVREDTDHAARAFTRLAEVMTLRNYGALVQPPGFRWVLPDPTEEARLKAKAEQYEAFHRAIKAEKENGFVVDQLRTEALAAEYSITPPMLADTRPQGGEIFAYHIDGQIVAKDEVRARLGLDALPDGAGSVERLAELLAPAAPPPALPPPGAPPGLPMPAPRPDAPPSAPPPSP